MFPPYARGGYEQWCEEVALALAARGHALCILTAQAGPAGAPDVDAGQPFPIHRLLHTEVEGGLGSTTLRLLRGTAQVEQANLGHVDTVVQHFQPDAGLIGDVEHLAPCPAADGEAAGEWLGYYFCDYWPTLPNAYVQRLQEPARRRSSYLGKALLARCFLPRLAAEDIPLRFPHPICVSRRREHRSPARLCAMPRRFTAARRWPKPRPRPPQLAAIAGAAAAAEPLRLFILGDGGSQSRVCIPSSMPCTACAAMQLTTAPSRWILWVPARRSTKPPARPCADVWPAGRR